MKKIKVRDMTLTAMFLALGILIPMLFHSLQWSGMMFLPMHIPIILCAMICGPFLGSICAVFAVFLSSFMTGMPPLYPMAVTMSFELVAYAIVSASTFKLLSKKLNIVLSAYIALIFAMLVGRLVLGVASVFFIGMLGNGYSLKAFVAGAFVTALPGIIIQLALIPWILYSLKKMRLITL